MTDLPPEEWTIFRIREPAIYGLKGADEWVGNDKLAEGRGLLVLLALDARIDTGPLSTKRVLRSLQCCVVSHARQTPEPEAPAALSSENSLNGLWAAEIGRASAQLVLPPNPRSVLLTYQ